MRLMSLTYDDGEWVDGSSDEAMERPIVVRLLQSTENTIRLTGYVGFYVARKN